jgi:general secretion pathway protein G
MRKMHRKTRLSHGFSLVEILIVTVILGMLAALVVPQFSNAQSIAKASSLKHELRYFRTQVMVYRAQHGVSPGHPNGNPAIVPTLETLVAQLTQFTDEKGNVSPVRTEQHRFGPYMPSLPVNPINMSSDVIFVGAKEQLPASPQGMAGWIYQPATTTVIANVQGADELGIAFFDY